MRTDTVCMKECELRGSYSRVAEGQGRLVCEVVSVAYPGQLRTEDRENGDLGSGGSCNLIQEISFHTVKLY